MSDLTNILQHIKFNNDGLVAVIAQEFDTKEILMMAWMNEEALSETLSTKQVCYFSRSRNQLWRKGETSGQTQKLIEMIIDCDGDTLIAMVEQKGVACHTGRKTCFFKTIKDNDIEINQEVITPPEDLYNDD